MSKNVTRLFEQFQPETYDLTIQLDPVKLTFKGSVTIHGKKVGRPSERLTFHQKDLKITKATVIHHDKKGDEPVVIGRINNQNSLNEVRLHTGHLVYPGMYTVTMEFHGVITKPMDGIYPCNFKHNGKDKLLLATQFESHYARQAFPCIDEPEAKAIFDLSLITPTKDTVISNTPLKEQVKNDAGYLTAFETTPRMSTYLLAFVYGEMGYTEAKTKDGVLVRAYATPDNVKLTDFGLTVAVRCLEFFSDYFGIAYPLPKLDMVALPDFSNGAMENWGLVTYRETCMLTDPDSGSIESKQLVALVICHELSHQWFGNLVTMKWWDDLWLNESFANMMEYQSVDALFPEWNILEQFVGVEATSAKRRDSLSDVQPIRSEVHHPDEINTLFDPQIVYAKGGTVLYMLLNYIGEEAFRIGLQQYFKKHRYGNTRAEDLWTALGTASKHDINGFMEGWLNRPGYPLVSIDWQPGKSKLSVTQKRFLSDPKAKSKNTEPWKVPLATTYPLSDDLFGTAASTMELTKPVGDNALLLNHDGHSYFLPHYTNHDHVEHIEAAIKGKRVDPIDRFLLLDNYVLLQRGGESSITELLDLLAAYEGEDNENVWGGIAMAFGDTRRLVDEDETINDLLNIFVAELVMPTVEQLGWNDKPDESVQTLRLRALVLSLAAGAKVDSVLAEGKKRFAAFTKPADLPATIRSVVYFIGSRYGDNADFQKLLKLHDTVLNADERDELAASLCATREPEHSEQLLALLTTDTVRRQDLLHWFVWILQNRYSRSAAWEWLTSHWDWIEKEFSSDKSYGFFARYAGNIFSYPEQLKQFQTFFNPKRDAVALSRDILLAEQDIISRIAWRERNEAAAKQWLKNRKP